MATRDFKEEFQDSFTSSNILAEIDPANPTKDVLGQNLSIPALLSAFITTQSQHQQTIYSLLADLDDTNKDAINTLITKNNLSARTLEQALQDHCKKSQGIDNKELLFLINKPPKEFGTEDKCSDTALRNVESFSGDTASNESNLNVFLRDIFALSSTNSLSEATTISVLCRKLTGSAVILIDNFITQKGGIRSVTLPDICLQLERKFITTYSPLAADTKLHSLTQGHMTYAQLQAQVQKFVKLATRMEPEETRSQLIKVKENTSFLLALSQEDRQCINQENSHRATSGLTALSLDQMVDLLIRTTSDKLSLREAVMAVEAQHPIPPQHPGAGQPPPVLPGQQVFKVDMPYNNRGRGGHRGRGRGAYNNKAQENRQNNNNNQGNLYNNKVNRGKNFNVRGQARKFVTCEMANVPKNACLHCASTTHLFGSLQCPYVNTPLMATPCKNCGRGVHMTASCQSKTQ